MGAMASQISSLTIVYSTIYSGADQRKHQSSASLAFVRGIHRGPLNSPHKWPVTRKVFPFASTRHKGHESFQLLLPLDIERRFICIPRLVNTSIILWFFSNWCMYIDSLKCFDTSYNVTKRPYVSFSQMTFKRNLNACEISHCHIQISPKPFEDTLYVVVTCHSPLFIMSTNFDKSKNPR